MQTKVIVGVKKTEDQTVRVNLTPIQDITHYQIQGTTVIPLNARTLTTAMQVTEKETNKKCT